MPEPNEDGACRYARNASTVSTAMGDGQLAILDTRNGEYYSINGTAAVLWTTLERPCEFAELVACLIRLYRVSSESAHDDVQAFLNKLLDRGLVARYSAA